MINATENLWRDEFRQLTFDFEGRQAILVFPKESSRTPHWALKNEYFSAFQDFEYELVKRGFHLAFLTNKSRWIKDDDLAAKYRFSKYLSEEFGLDEKCVEVGMSCGGLHAIKQAATYPQMISAMFLDAPVVNLLSCPFGFGNKRTLSDEVKQEALTAMNMTVSDIIAYRDHPLDRIPDLIKYEIPLLLVCGGEDLSVPFEENGIYLKNAYENSNVHFKFIFYKERGHHPHGPNALDMESAIEFILKERK